MTSLTTPHAAPAAVVPTVRSSAATSARSTGPQVARVASAAMRPSSP